MPDATVGRGRPGLGRRGVLAAALLGLCAAAPPGKPAATAIAQVTPPPAAAVARIQGFATTLLSIMKMGRRTPFVQRFNALAPAVDATFDLETILRNSVGLQWSTLPQDQRNALLATFRRYTIATWVANFNAWSGQQFTVSPNVRQAAGDIIVQTDLVPASGSPTNISYVMRPEATGWKVVDVLAQGTISRVAVQRSDFRSLLESGGVPALMASLQRKITSLSDGGLA